MTADDKNIKSVLPDSDIDQVMISTIPKKFIKKTGSSSSSKQGRGIIYALYGLIGLVIAGGGFAVWYFVIRNQPAVKSSVPDINMPPFVQQPVTSSPSVTEPPKPSTQPISVKFTAKNFSGEEVGYVIVKLAGEDADQAEEIKVFSVLPEQVSGLARQAVGAIYSFSSASGNLQLTKPIELTFGYFEGPKMTSQQENSLRLSREVEAGKWEFVDEATLDIVGNKIKYIVNDLPQERLTILSNLESVPTLESQPTEPQPTEPPVEELIPLTSSLDSDRDGLTDQEETLYGSDSQLPDSDSDGYVDGQELLNFYSPVSTSTLLADGLVKIYKNTSQNYSVYYPSTWKIKVDDYNNTIITSAQDDFINIAVQDNKQELSIIDWYISLNSKVSPDDLKVETVGQYQGVRSPDNANFYLAAGDKVYIFTYGAGVKNEVDYLTTWEMIYRSFELITADEIES